MHLRIQFPTRGRPEQFRRIADEYISRLRGSPWSMQIILDSDDSGTLQQLSGQLKPIIERPEVQLQIAPHASKIEAVNDAAGRGPWDILLLASDDMWPVVDGYDEIIRNRMRKHYPDTDGVLWFNDGYQQNRLNTLCILGRSYYGRFHYIYHPAYKSMYCDNEFTDVAKKLKRQTYFDQVIIEHRHPACGKAQLDGVYRRNQLPQGRDQRTYVQRKKRGFP